MGAQIRLSWMGVLFLGIGLLIGARLVLFQVLEHEDLRAKADAEHRHQVTVRPRGDILDRNGQPLAITVMYGAVEIVGAQVKSPGSSSRDPSSLPADAPEEIQPLIDQQNQAPVLVKNGLPAATITSIESADIPGVVTRPVQSRNYPEGSLAARVIGMVGTDYHGLAGIENYYDDELSGTPGLLDTELNTVGQEIILGRKMRLPPEDGADIVLTIDRYTQRMAERLLAGAVQTNKSTGGSIIIMDPSTGEVLASATLPAYDLNDEKRFSPESIALFKSAEVADQYEPGSVLKVLTMAAGLEDGVVTPQTTLNDTGLVTVNGVAVRNWNLAGNGVINMTEVLIHSSNIGAQFVAGKLGPERFYDYYTRFGLGVPSGADLRGDSRHGSHQSTRRLEQARSGDQLIWARHRRHTDSARFGDGGRRERRPAYASAVRERSAISTRHTDHRTRTGESGCVTSNRANATRHDGPRPGAASARAVESSGLPSGRENGDSGLCDDWWIQVRKDLRFGCRAGSGGVAPLCNFDQARCSRGNLRRRCGSSRIGAASPGLYTYYRVPPTEAIPGGQ